MENKETNQAEEVVKVNDSDLDDVAGGLALDHDWVVHHKIRRGNGVTFKFLKCRDCGLEYYATNGRQIDRDEYYRLLAQE